MRLHIVHLWIIYKSIGNRKRKCEWCTTVAYVPQSDCTHTNENTIHESWINWMTMYMRDSNMMKKKSWTWILARFFSLSLYCAAFGLIRSLLIACLQSIAVLTLSPHPNRLCLSRIVHCTSLRARTGLRLSSLSGAVRYDDCLSLSDFLLEM